MNETDGKLHSLARKRAGLDSRVSQTIEKTLGDGSEGPYGVLIPWIPRWAGGWMSIRDAESLAKRLRAGAHAARKTNQGACQACQRLGCRRFHVGQLRTSNGRVMRVSKQTKRSWRLDPTEDTGRPVYTTSAFSWQLVGWDV